MKELLARANEINKAHGIMSNYAIDSYADIVKAIHVVQDEMGITGTTAKEATDTIQGTLSKTKAAWDNLITGLGDKNADLQKLTNDLVEGIVGGTDEAGNQFKGVIQNVLPIAEQALGAVGNLIIGVGKVISEELPTIIKNEVPKLFEVLITLIKEFISTLPNLLPEIINVLLTLVDIIGNELPSILQTLAELFETTLPAIIPQIIDFALKIVEILTSPEVIESVINMATTLIVALVEGLISAIPKIIEALPTIIGNIIKGLISAIPQLIEAGVKLFVAIVQNLPAIIAGIIKALPEIIAAIIEGLSPLGEMLGNLFSNWWDGIVTIFSPLVEFFGNLFSSVWDTITTIFSPIIDFFANIWEGIKTAFSNVAGWFRDIFSNAWDGIRNVFAPVGEMFGNIGKGILNGLSSVINGIIWGINQVIKIPFDGLNFVLRAIKGVNIFGLKPFDWVNEIGVPQIPSIPMLATGGVLKRGQVALLEGQGDEAIIPLSQNTEWIDNVADRLNSRTAPTATYNYDIHIEVANMNANNESEIEELAERLMKIMAEKTSRRRGAYG